MQESINERIKFLIKSLDLSVRAFSAALGVPVSTTRNYIDKGTKPSTDYIEHIAEHFKTVNTHWLITGTGEPFIDGNPAQTQTNISGNGINIASGKGGKAVQKNYTVDECARDRDLFRQERDAAHREIEHLKAQLQMKDTIIQGKDEMLDLLRGGFNRPN